MAEEPKKDAADAGGKPSALKPLLGLVVAVVVPMLAAAGFYFAVLKPKMTPKDTGKEGGGHEVEAAMPEEEGFPKGTKGVPLKEGKASIIVEKDQPSLILIYQIMLVCNAKAAALMKEDTSLFEAVAADKIRNRTRDEIMMPMVQDTILKQIQQECNALIKRLEGAHAKESEDSPKVLQVKFLQWMPVSI